MKCGIPASTSLSISDSVSSSKSLRVSDHIVILKLFRLTPSAGFSLGVAVQLDAIVTALFSAGTTS